MAVIAAQSIAETGLAPTYSAVNASDTLTNNGNSILDVKNGNAASLTVTVTAVNNCNQGFSHNMVVTIAAGAEKQIGPFSIVRFGYAPVVTYSVQTSVTAALITLS